MAVHIAIHLLEVICLVELGLKSGCSCGTRGAESVMLAKYIAIIQMVLEKSKITPYWFRLKMFSTSSLMYAPASRVAVPFPFWNTSYTK